MPGMESYRSSPALRENHPWKSEWTTKGEDEEILTRINREFPEASAFAKLAVEGAKPGQNLNKMKKAQRSRVKALTMFVEGRYKDMKKTEADLFTSKLRELQLLDVINFVCDGPNVQRETHFRLPDYLHTSDVLEGNQKEVASLYSHLEDWGAMIQEAERSLSMTYSKQGSSSNLLSDDETRLVGGPSQTLLPHSLCRAHKFGNLATCGHIVSNLLYMIFMIGYLFQGHQELPSTIEELGEQLGLDPSDDTWVNIRDKMKPRHVRGAFTAALCISPLVAFADYNFGKRPLTEAAAYSLWVCLGSEKPDSLQKAEHIMWKFLFDVAKGNETNMSLVIVQILDQIGRVAKEAESVDLKWFSRASVQERKRAAEAGTLNTPVIGDKDVDMDGEREPDKLGEEEGERPTSEHGGEREEDDIQMGEPEAEGQEKDADMNVPEGEEGEGMNEGPAGKRTTKRIQRRIQLRRTVATKMGKTEGMSTGSPKRKRARKSKAQVDGVKEDGLGEMRRLYREFLLRLKNTDELKPMQVSTRPSRQLKGDSVMSIPLPIVGGEPVFYTLDTQFHLPSQLESVKAIYDAYLPNQGVSLNDPRSPFRIVDWAEYKDMSEGDILETFRDKNLIIVNRPLEDSIGVQGPVAFDENGLRHLGPLGRPVVMHDLSKNLDGDDDNDEVEHIQGTLSDLLVAKRDGRSLNLLDCPFYSDYGKPQVWDLGCTSWEHLSSAAPCKALGNFPMNVSRWGLAATQGCIHPWHVDSSGFLAFFTILTGVKIFALGVPKPGHSISTTDAFIDLNTLEGNSDRFDVWMVALQPGTQYVQTAHQLHYVITAEDSIVMGGHTYVTPAIQRTSYSIYHQFVAGYDLTNNENMKEGFMLLYSILNFYHLEIVKKGREYSKENGVLCHLPDLSQCSGLLDLITLYHLIELGNVIAPWGYRNPVEGAADRFVMITVRQMARELVDSVRCRYEVGYEEGADADESDGSVWEKIVDGGLVKTAATLVVLKRQHEKIVLDEGLSTSDSVVTAKSVEKAGLRALLRNKSLATAYQTEIKSMQKGDFAYTGPSFWIKRRLDKLPGMDNIDGFTFDDLDILGEEGDISKIHL